MYVMEYLLYHLRPYGIDSKVRYENDKTTESTSSLSSSKSSFNNTTEDMVVVSKNQNDVRKSDEVIENSQKSNLPDSVIETKDNEAKNNTSVGME